MTYSRPESIFSSQAVDRWGRGRRLAANSPELACARPFEQEDLGYSVQALSAVANLTHGKILNEITSGEGMMVSPPGGADRGFGQQCLQAHGEFAEGGVGARGQGRLYHLTDLSRPIPETNEVDLGAIILRFLRRKA